MLEIKAGVILLYFCCFFFGIIILWVIDRHRYQHNFLLNHDRRFRCDNCNKTFVSKERDPVTVTRCVRCNHICFHKKKRDLA